MVPPPLDGHEQLSDDLYALLRPRARSRGLIARGGTPGLYSAESDWRVPDQLYARRDQLREQRFRGAVLVVEIRSPGDESYEKLPFYAAVGVPEVLIIDRATKSVELFRLGDGRYAIEETGTSTSLDVAFRQGDVHVIVEIDGVEHAI